MSKKWLLVPAALAGGVALYSVMPKTLAIPSAITPILSPIQTWFTNLTEPVRTILMSSVPTAAASIAGKAAYDKMKKSQEIAVARVQDLQGDLLQENTVKNQFQTQVKTLESQVADVQKQLTDTQNFIAEQKQMYENKITKIQKDLDNKTAEYNLAVRTLAEKSKIKAEPERVP